MPEERACPECGAAIPPGSTRGFCAQCLFALGLESPAPHPPALPAPDLMPLLARATPAIGVKFHYFGDYELLEELARGGMAVVFRARQISLNRTVALKLITAGQLATEAAVRRFHLEAEAAARLDHANIVPIYEIGEHEGQHYFAMKLLEGGSLARHLSARKPARPHPSPFPPPREPAPPTSDGSSGCDVDGRHRPTRLLPSRGRREEVQAKAIAGSLRASVALLVKVAQAVHYAHQRGVLHRDLKPGNILLDERGEPHVTDFGLAKLMEHDSSLTLSGMVMGTPSYMSPEQAAGKSAELTTASDLWGLGAILYELLTGQPPFRGGTPMETLRQMAEHEPRKPSALNPAVGRDLETICLKCLSKDPARRYASAAALADDLERWLHHEPILARRARVPERVLKWAQRQPVFAAAVVLLHVVLGLGLAGIVWQWHQAVVARRAETNERQRAARAEAHALDRLHEAKLNYVRANRLTGRPAQRFNSLAELANLAARTNGLDLRNEAIACLALPDLRLLKHWTKTPLWDSFKFSPSLQRYATNDALGNLTIRDTETDAVLAQLPVQGAKPVASFAVFSPDDRWVAAMDEAGQVRLHDLEAGTSRPMNVPHGAALIAFTPDSRALVVKYPDDSLHFLNTAHGTDEKSFPGPPRLHWYDLHFDSSGDKFLATTEGTVAIRRAADGAHLQTLLPPENANVGFGRAVWHPDGRRVACAWLNHVGLWDMEDGRQQALFAGHDSPIMGLTFTRTGDYLASVSWDHTTRLWHTDIGREALILPEAGNVLAIGADDRRLSFQTWDHRQVKLYELADLTAAQRLSLPPPKRRLDRHTGQIVFSPDGELVLVPDHDGIYVFRAQDPAPVALVPVAEARSVCPAPDGRALYVVGEDGAQRWPVAWSEDRSEWHVGPPQGLEPTRGLTVWNLELSRNGQWLLAYAENALLTFRSEPPAEAVRFDPGARPGCPPQLDPEGRWVATITPARDQIQIRQGRTGGLVTNLPSAGAWQLAFSPDGRWLACAQRDSTTIWETADWSRRHRIAHPLADVRRCLAFSPDSRMLATLADATEIRLVTAARGEELATFPAGRLTTGLSFSPAGDRLTVAHEPGHLRIWDLRRVREQLAVLHLDWDLPPIPPPDGTVSVRTVRVMIHTNAPARSVGTGDN